MRTILGITLALAIAAPLAAQVEPVQEEKPSKTLELGGLLKSVFTSLPDMDGKEVKAEDLDGKTVVVNFYSIRCPIQRDWDQRIVQIQRDRAREDVVFLHINSNYTEIGETPPKEEDGNPSYKNIREHLERNSLPYRILLDHGNRVADLWGAKTTPHIHVFDKTGRLVYRGLVDDDQRNVNPEGRRNHLVEVLEKLSRDETVIPFQTKEIGCVIQRVPPKDEQDGAGKDRR